MRLALALLVLASTSAAGQPALWTDLAPGRAAPRPDLAAYRPVRLDLGAFRAVLEGASATAPVRVPVPLPDGGVLEVDAVEAPVLAAGLQARYPSIRTYVLSGAATGRIAVTPHGVSGLVHGPGGAVAFDPVGPGGAADAEVYAVYRPSDVVLEGAAFEDAAFEGAALALEAGVRGDALEAGPVAHGETLRTLRFAVAATGEFTQSRGGTVELGLAAVAASVNRVNAILERDLAVRLEVVAGNDKLVFVNGATDPFTEAGDGLLIQVQGALDQAVGNEAYDVGHLVTAGRSGLANTGAVCQRATKGRAFSGVGDGSAALDLFLLPHEVGHQLGASHTFTTVADGEFNPAGVEPGVGYTLMAYPYLAAHRPEGERFGFYYHAASIAQITGARWYGREGCGSRTPTGNDVPQVAFAHSRVVPVPVGSFFVLEGAATDASGTALSYTWEQLDPYGDGVGPVPRFSSADPGPSPSRTFPDLEAALAGTLGPREGVADRAGTHAVRLTVRDNVPGGGALASDDVEVVVYDDAGPFAVTSHQRTVRYAPGGVGVVTWDPATFARSRVDAVDVSLSTDDGVTWTPALEGAPNTGTATVSVPETPTDRGRVMVRPVGRRYFAVGAAPFVIGPAPSASLSQEAVRLRVAPGGRASATVVVTNVGDPAVALEVAASLENVNPATIDASGGYTLLRSGEPCGPAVGYRDISWTGERASFVLDPSGSPGDNNLAPIELPFSFPFFDRWYDVAYVSTNGLVGFGPCPTGREGFPCTSSDAINRPIPFPSVPNGFVAPFWDDLRLGSGAVYTKTLADGRLAVQYDRVGRPVGAGNYTFQVLLSPQGDVEVQYGPMVNVTAGATIGLEGPDGAEGIEVAYNELVALSGTALSFDRTGPDVSRGDWLAFIASDTAALGGRPVEVVLEVDLEGVGGIGEGDRLTADLVLETNDGSRPRVIVPVEVAVGGAVSAGPALEAAAVSAVRPNPASGRTVLEVALAAPGPLRVAVYDALGRRVAVPFEGAAAGVLEVDLEAEALAPGLYVARVEGGGVVTARTFVVAR